MLFATCEYAESMNAMTPWRPSVPGVDEPGRLSVAAMPLPGWPCPTGRTLMMFHGQNGVIQVILVR
ncbi:MAG: hypothetical protein QOE89_2050 [Pseudonocardiales bacterium]|jgi:hypothetical protein|nr:hypothetical protein [Pseudonocardiales bacterium]